jgi:hypothetical protein
MGVDLLQLNRRKRDSVELTCLKDHVADLKLRVFGDNSVAQWTDPLDSNNLLEPILENYSVKVLYHHQLSCQVTH